MKRIATLGIGALALASLSLPSFAADLKAPPPVAPPVLLYNWSGFYVGAHVGYGWGSNDWTDTTLVGVVFPDGGHDLSGFLLGGQIGFNWQAGNWVFGVEAQVSWANNDGTHLCLVGLAFCNSQTNWLGTVAGRIGYAFNNVLVYGKGGFAFIDQEFLVFDAATFGGLFLAAADQTRTGWMVGVGLEYGFTPNWSFKIEYNFMDFGGDNFNFVDPIIGPLGIFEIEQQISVVKAGVNYRFNWGAAPVVARY